MKLAAIVAALAAGWTVVATVAAVILGRHLKARDHLWPEVDDDERPDEREGR